MLILNEGFMIEVYYICQYSVYVMYWRNDMMFGKERIFMLMDTVTKAYSLISDRV